MLALLWKSGILLCFPNYQSKVTCVIFMLSEMDDKVGMPSIVSLNATNYTTWKTYMEDILYVKDLYEPILRETIPSSVVAKEWEILN